MCVAAVVDVGGQIRVSSDKGSLSEPGLLLAAARRSPAAPPDHEKPAVSQIKRNKVAPDSLTRARAHFLTVGARQAGRREWWRSLCSSYSDMAKVLY